MAPEPALNAERQRLAKQYARQKRALLASGAFLAAAYLVAWQLGLARARVSVTSSLAIAALFATIAVGWELVGLPNAWIGYQLARGYGLSTQSARSWFADKAKALGLLLVLGGSLVEITYWLMRSQPAWWWLVDAGVLLLFTVVLANLAPVLIVPLFFKFTPLDDAELAARLMRLVREAGTNVRGVFTMHLSAKTTAANAALMGWGNTRRIVVGDTLVAQFTPDETEAVLAHELGHHVHHDIWQAMAIQTATTTATLWLTAAALNLIVEAGWLHGLGDAQNMPAVALLLGFFGAIFTPLTNWASRVAEARADRYAMERASRPSAFVDSMIRLANQNLAEVDPPRWVEILLYDHPALSRRIRAFDERRSARAKPV